MRRTHTPTHRTWFRITLILSLVALTATAFSATAIASPKPKADWPMFGQNLNNTANAPDTSIGTGNVKNLKLKWAFTASGDVSARAAVVGKVAYFPDWDGNLYAVNSANGKLIWQKNILSLLNGYLPSAVTNPDGSPATTVVSRTSPFVDTSTNTLYIGTQTGAYLLAIDTGDGHVKWAHQLDSHPFAMDTQSPVVYDGVVYVGVSSLEEGAAAYPSYPCCSFRGSVVALNATTGQQIWQTHTVPEGYSGGAVWGSTIVPDPQLGLVFATTGNNYSTSTDPAYTACIDNGGTLESCLSPDDHVDSVLALNMNDGSVAWSQRLASSDDFNGACLFAGLNAPNCPTNTGPDYDFGSGANLFTVQTANGPKAILGAGQKSGNYSAFDPETGTLLWTTKVGPGSALGGMEWGSATDGQRIYVAIGNLDNTPYTLPSGEIATAGSWAALDAATGQILWQVADPNGAMDQGPMTVANGVVYAPSMGRNNSTGEFSQDATPTMFALDAATGSILWDFASGGSVAAGAVVANDTIYWGSGYSHLAVFGGVGDNGSNTFYAFNTGGQ